MSWKRKLTNSKNILHVEFKIHCAAVSFEGNTSQKQEWNSPEQYKGLVINLN